MHAQPTQPHQRLSEALFLALRDLDQERFDLVANAIDAGQSLGSRSPVFDALRSWRRDRGSWRGWPQADRDTALGMLQALDILSPGFLEIRSSVGDLPGVKTPSSIGSFPLQLIPALGMAPDELEDRLIHPILLGGHTRDDFIEGCYASAALERDKPEPRGAGETPGVSVGAAELFPGNTAIEWMELVWIRSGLRYQDCLSDRAPSTPLAAAARAGAGEAALTHLLAHGADPLYSPNAPFENSALAQAALYGNAHALGVFLRHLRHEWSDLSGALIPERQSDWDALLPALLSSGSVASRPRFSAQLLSLFHGIAP